MKRNEQQLKQGQQMQGIPSEMLEKLKQEMQNGSGQGSEAIASDSSTLTAEATESTQEAPIAEQGIQS